MASSPPTHARSHCNHKHNETYSARYERMAGNCTRIVAEHIIATISPPITSASYILDNACGPGTVSEQIKHLHPDAKVMATDLNEGMIKEVEKQIRVKGWTNMQTGLSDIKSLHNMPDATFTHAITNFGMCASGNSESGLKAFKELFRVLQVGGVAVVTTWADRVWPATFTEVQNAIRPNESTHVPVNLDPHILTGSWLMRNLEDGGFGNNVEVRPYMSYMTAKTLDEMMENMMTGGHACFRGYSEEPLGKAKNLMKEALRKCRTFEEYEDGVRIGMKAWIGVGWKRGDEQEVPQ